MFLPFCFSKGIKLFFCCLFGCWFTDEAELFGLEMASAIDLVWKCVAGVCYKAAPCISLTDISYLCTHFSLKSFYFSFALSLTLFSRYFLVAARLKHTNICHHILIHYWLCCILQYSWEMRKWIDFSSKVVKENFWTFFMQMTFLCFNLCVCLFGVTNLWKYDNAFMLCLDIFSVDFLSFSFLSCCIYVFVQCVPWKIITDILTTEFNLKDIKKDWGRYIGIHVILICLFFLKRMNIWMITA